MLVRCQLTRLPRLPASDYMYLSCASVYIWVPMWTSMCRVKPNTHFTMSSIHTYMHIHTLNWTHVELNSFSRRDNCLSELMSSSCQLMTLQVSCWYVLVQRMLWEAAPQSCPQTSSNEIYFHDIRWHRHAIISICIRGHLASSGTRISHLEILNETLNQFTTIETYRAISLTELWHKQ